MIWLHNIVAVGGPYGINTEDAFGGNRTAVGVAIVLLYVSTFAIISITQRFAKRTPDKT